MKGFTRTDLWFSLCGLNCGLCPMLLGGHCGGCGNGNQSCKIARCSMEQPERVEYCYQCGKFPCEKYEGMDEYDSFITHRNRLSDLKRAEEMGPDAYCREQEERRDILDRLLDQYNDGRHKTLYCLGTNLLPLKGLRDILERLETDPALAKASPKERAQTAAGLFQRAAEECKIELKLRKKT